MGLYEDTSFSREDADINIGDNSCVEREDKLDGRSEFA